MCMWLEERYVSAVQGMKVGGSEGQKEREVQEVDLKVLVVRSSKLA